MGIAKILNIFSVKKQTVYKTSQIDKKNIPLLIMYNSLQIFCHLLPIAFLVIHVKVIGVFPAIHSLTGAMCKIIEDSKFVQFPERKSFGQTKLWPVISHVFLVCLCLLI